MIKGRQNIPIRTRFLLLFGVLLIVLLSILSSQNKLLNRNLILQPSSDEIDKQVVQSTTVHLTLSVPKSGTTALSWIAYSLFTNVKKEVLSEDRRQNIKVYSPEKQTTLVWDDYKLSFNCNKKHRGVLHECRRGKVKKAVEFPFDHHLNQFLSTNHSADTEHFRRILKKSRALKVMQNSTSCRGDVKHVAIFRDPIATSVSYQKYFFPGSTKEQISEVLMTKACNKRPALTAAVWILSTEIMPSFGFNVETLFYRDLRKTPFQFVSRFSRMLGLKVSDDLIARVVNETSPDRMRGIQEQLKRLSSNSSVAKDLKKHFHGLSRKGQNSRKVRTASLKGYEEEITREALEYCREKARYHLPAVLLEKFELV